jgi:acyl-CoA synthetase (AMP-forming)/AMP-acid ligase II
MYRSTTSACLLLLSFVSFPQTAHAANFGFVRWLSYHDVPLILAMIMTGLSFALFKTQRIGRAIGVEVAIMDRFGNPLGTGKTGEVCVDIPTVFDGYKGTAKDDVFFEGSFRTGDTFRCSRRYRCWWWCCSGSSC